MKHAYCLVCDKELQITKNDVGVRVVHDGMAINIDIDEGSRYNKYYGQESFLTKLISCNHITAFLCDDCLEKKQNQCYGTKIEVKRTYEDVFPEST